MPIQPVTIGNPPDTKDGLEFGVAFDAPVTQTILPIVIKPTGMMAGFYFIPSTAFTGNETTFALANGSVPVDTVQHPYTVDDGSGFYKNSAKFMAAVWDVDQESKAPWQGHTEWVDTNNTGMFSRWSMPVQAVRNIVSEGALFESFRVRMNIVAAQPTPPQPLPPDGDNATMSWVSVGEYDTLAQDCAFFDVNWFELFQTTYKQTYILADGTTARVPIRITPLTVPPEFKVMVVKAAGTNVIAQGGEVYDTLRFIRTGSLNIAAGGTANYNFTFEIVDDFNQTTSVSLTLTVKRP